MHDAKHVEVDVSRDILVALGECKVTPLYWTGESRASMRVTMLRDCCWRDATTLSDDVKTTINDIIQFAIDNDCETIVMQAAIQL